VNNAFAGIQLRQGAATVMRNLELIGCGKPVYINPAAGKGVVHTTMHNVWCDSSSDVGLMLDGSLGQIIDVRVSDGWNSGCNIGIRLTGIVRGVKIHGMEIINNANTGIVVDDGADITGLSIDNNEIAQNASAGISIGNNVVGFGITNNVIGGASHFGPNGQGIYLGTAADNYRIFGNDLRANTTVPITGHTGRSLSKLVANNLGFVTNNSGAGAGTTDSSGSLSFAHGLYKVPVDARITVYGAGSTTPFLAHISGFDATNIQAKFFNGLTPINAGPVSYYWVAEA
jgi:hypothetical protein